jgi:hypothetical protein
MKEKFPENRLIWDELIFETTQGKSLHSSFQKGCFSLDNIVICLLTFLPYMSTWQGEHGNLPMIGG